MRYCTIESTVWLGLQPHRAAQMYGNQKTRRCFRSGEFIGLNRQAFPEGLAENVS